jgi:hypothetical protein
MFFSFSPPWKLRSRKSNRLSNPAGCSGQGLRQANARCFSSKQDIPAQKSLGIANEATNCFINLFSSSVL